MIIVVDQSKLSPVLGTRHALPVEVLGFGLYALLYADALLVEVAYQFDRYGRTAMMVALAAGGWIFVTSLAGLAVDWKLTFRGSNKGLIASVCVFLAAVAILFAGSCLFLPAEPITQSVRQAYTAQTRVPYGGKSMVW